MAKAMKAQWNTGRQYAKEGQLIVAELVDDSTEEETKAGIVFDDLSRGVGGYIPLSGGCLVGDARKLRDLTMANYDLGNYHYDGRALSLAWDDETKAA